MPDGRHPIDRYLDRVLRLLERSVEADKAERKKQRAAERQKKKGKVERAQMKILNIESEVDYIAFLHDVVFSFEA